jgi:hypothetical protein
MQIARITFPTTLVLFVSLTYDGSQITSGALAVYVPERTPTTLPLSNKISSTGVLSI